MPTTRNERKLRKLAEDPAYREVLRERERNRRPRNAEHQKWRNAYQARYAQTETYQTWKRRYYAKPGDPDFDPSTAHHWKITSSPLGRAKTLFQNAKSRSFHGALSFDLTVPWILAKLEAGYCELTGLPLDLACAAPGQTFNAMSPSLDRREPDEGYTQANVRVTVWIYNRARGAFADDDLLTMCRALVARAGS